MHARQLGWLAALVYGLLGATWVSGAGGTSQVASPTRKVTAEEGWPKGLETLINHPARTHGWNPWFTEWPNDVIHFQFAVKDTDTANAVLAEFAKIDADLQVRLALGKEPAGIGWVSRLDAGNDTPMLLSVGNQVRLSAWYDQLGGRKFGVMEFERCPVAVPPTFTIYIQNKAIDLDKLKIPAKVTVSAGDVPGAFHISNLKPVDRPPPVGKKVDPAELEPDVRAALEKLQKFLERRKQTS